MYVRLKLENGYIDMHHIWHAYSLRSGRDFRKVKLRNSGLNSNPFEGSSYRSENKDARRTARKPKLFVSKRRLQKQRPEHRKPALCSSPGEDVFCNLGTNDGGRRHDDDIVSFGEETAGKNATTLKKVSWVRVTVKTNVLLFRDYIFSMILNDSSKCRMIKLMIRFGTRKIDKKMLIFLKFPRSNNADTLLYLI
jgi:hypothetical protein